MKKTAFILFLFFLLSFSFAPGGYDYHKRININYYERTYNLQYIGVDDSVQLKNSRGKTYKEPVVSNIAIHDIKTEKTEYIFKDTIKHTITGFYFESAYLDKYKTIEFNNNFDSTSKFNWSLYEFSNNHTISKRGVSENLIILTLDLSNNKEAFWICDKRGNNLKKVLEFDRFTHWEIDVYNRKIRVIDQLGGRVQIDNASY